MKRLEIYFDSYLLEKVQEEVKEYGIDQYILIPKVFSEWDKNLKHFNSHVWPGTDSILVAYVSDEQAKEIMRVIKMIKIDLGKMISMGAVVIPVEDIIL
ncbi:MAG: hypothetical protein KBA67_03860 [Leptotrichiaceae bacterium]|nr:hypothetical protein [Leptotrichiaceae bacterium]MBP6281807.1 hypothetical protein [Leptotrichiaceae bacterium]MBP7100649.1 hypothetical protein [Leptotrichiaceae bacterium]MBP9479595.1 hypothetical protein [Sebaldella sp.]